MSDNPAVHPDPPYGGERGPAHQLKRPGTVVAAAVLTWLAVVLTTYGTLMLLYLILQFDPILDLLYLAEIVRWYARWAAIAVVAWCLVAAGLATQVMRGRNWARIALAGSAALVVVVSALTIQASEAIMPVGVLLAFGLVVIVLLSTGGANEWFRAAARNRTKPPVLGHNHRHA